MEGGWSRSKSTAPKITMMHAEFEKITGLSVGREVYRMIEDAYMASGEIDKHQFCDDYMSNNDKVLENFLKLTEQKLEDNRKSLSEALKMIADNTRELTEAKTQTIILQKRLDAELQWTLDKTMGTSLNQESYLEDTEDSFVKNAKAFDPVEIVARMCGFQKELVHLVDIVSSYERNKYGQVRIKETYTRKAYYVSGDWNYICFSVNGLKYELINGELHFYDYKESFSTQLVAAKKQIDKLQSKLDEELRWTPEKTMGTNLTQKNYLEDIEDSVVKNAEPFDPVEIVARVCGFQKELVHLIDTVSTYERNKYGQLRVSKTYTRKAYYVSGDWNYIRFDVKGLKYELIDGELQFYCD